MNPQSSTSKVLGFDSCLDLKDGAKAQKQDNEQDVFYTGSDRQASGSAPGMERDVDSTVFRGQTMLDLKKAVESKMQSSKGNATSQDDVPPATEREPIVFQMLTSDHESSPKKKSTSRPVDAIRDSQSDRKQLEPQITSHEKTAASSSAMGLSKQRSECEGQTAIQSITRIPTSEDQTTETLQTLSSKSGQEDAVSGTVSIVPNQSDGLEAKSKDIEVSRSKGQQTRLLNTEVAEKNSLNVEQRVLLNSEDCKQDLPTSEVDNEPGLRQDRDGEDSSQNFEQTGSLNMEVSDETSKETIRTGLLNSAVGNQDSTTSSGPKRGRAGRPRMPNSDDTKRYPCLYCGKKFSRSSHRSDHERTHNDDSKFPCDKCGKLYSRKRIMVKHQKTCGLVDKNRFHCRKCKQSFPTKAKKDKHLKSHIEERRYKCSLCTKKFKYQSNLSDHIRSHDATMQFKCSICSKTFTRRRALARHMKNHNDTDIFVLCYLCNTGFQSQEKLKSHQRSYTGQKQYACIYWGDFYKHSKQRYERNNEINSRFKCSSCEKQFHTERQLYLHKVKYFTRDTKSLRKCWRCKMVFHSVTGKKQHCKTHRKRLFSCWMCGKRFKYACHLTEHVKTHDKDDLTCLFCPASFSNQRLLATHVRHSIATQFCYTNSSVLKPKNLDEKKCQSTVGIPCKTCSQMLPDKFHLKAHEVLLHQNVCRCEHCPFICLTNDQMKDHIEKKHPAVGDSNEQARSDLATENEEAGIVDTDNQQKEAKLVVSTNEAYADWMESSDESDKKKRYPCVYCLRRFCNSSHRNEHERGHDVGSQFPCPNCDKTFTRRRSLVAHQRKCKGGKSVSTNAPQEHETESTEAVNQDSKPDVPTDMSANLTEEQNQEEPQEQYPDERTLEEDQAMDSTPVEIKLVAICEFCDRTFRSQKGMQNHQRNKHEGVAKPYSCVECTNTYATKSERDEHMASVHPNARTFKCRYCPKRFKVGHHCREHELLHDVSAQLKCNYCNKGFTTKRYLRMHQSRQRSKKPWICKICNKVFEIKSCVAHHEKVCSEEMQNAASSSQVEKQVCEKKEHGKSQDRVRRPATKAEEDEAKYLEFLNRIVELHFHQTKDSDFTPLVDGQISKCRFCGVVFESHLIRIKHQFLHTRKESASCWFCNESFESEIAKTEHEANHRINSHLCQNCGTFFKSEHLLLTHSCENPHQSIKYHCNICKQDFQNPLDLIAHERRHPGIRAYTCSHCQKRFLNSNSYEYHMQSEHGLMSSIDENIVRKRFLQCRFCRRSFWNHQDYLEMHEKSHSGPKPYECYYCKATFSTRTLLLKHEETHAKERPYQCLICGHRYDSSKHLNDHISRHGESQVRCEHCNRQFTSEVELMRHEKDHPEMKTYNCKYCDDKFACDVVRRLHMRRKHSIMHMCPLCTQEMSSSPLLIKHLLEHRKRHKFLFTKDDTESQGGKSDQKMDFCEGATWEVSLTDCDEDFFPLALTTAGSHQEANLDSGLSDDDDGELIARNDDNLCPLCREKFATSSALARHLIRHKNELQSPCKNNDLICNGDLYGSRLASTDIQKDVSFNGHKIHAESTKSTEVMDGGDVEHIDATPRKLADNNISSCPLCSQHFATSSALARHLVHHKRQSPSSRKISSSSEVLSNKDSPPTVIGNTPPSPMDRDNFRSNTQPLPGNQKQSNQISSVCRNLESYLTNHATDHVMDSSPIGRKDKSTFEKQSSELGRERSEADKNLESYSINHVIDHGTDSSSTHKKDKSTLKKGISDFEQEKDKCEAANDLLSRLPLSKDAECLNHKPPSKINNLQPAYNTNLQSTSPVSTCEGAVCPGQLSCELMVCPVQLSHDKSPTSKNSSIQSPCETTMCPSRSSLNKDQFMNTEQLSVITDQLNQSDVKERLPEPITEQSHRVIDMNQSDEQKQILSNHSSSDIQPNHPSSKTNSTSQLHLTDLAPLNLDSQACNHSHQSEKRVSFELECSNKSSAVQESTHSPSASLSTIGDKHSDLLTIGDSSPSAVLTCSVDVKPPSSVDDSHYSNQGSAVSSPSSSTIPTCSIDIKPPITPTDANQRPVLMNGCISNVTQPNRSSPVKEMSEAPDVKANNSPHCEKSSFYITQVCESQSDTIKDLEKKNRIQDIFSTSEFQPRNPSRVINIENEKESPPKCGNEVHDDRIVSNIKVEDNHSQFCCKFCHKEFREHSLCKIHERLHTPEMHWNIDRFTCKFCSKSFDNENQRNAHEDLHVPGTLLQKNGFCHKNVYEWNSHQDRKEPCTPSKQMPTLQQMPTGLFQCKFCQKKFIEPKQCADHEVLHTPSKHMPTLQQMPTDWFQCKYCPKKFVERKQCNDHEALHTPEKLWRCNVCNISFFSKRLLEEHYGMEQHKLLVDQKECGEKSEEESFDDDTEDDQEEDGSLVQPNRKESLAQPSPKESLAQPGSKESLAQPSPSSKENLLLPSPTSNVLFKCEHCWRVFISTDMLQKHSISCLENGTGTVHKMVECSSYQQSGTENETTENETYQQNGSEPGNEVEESYIGSVLEDIVNQQDSLPANSEFQDSQGSLKCEFPDSKASCKFCRKVFKNSAVLANHVEIHSNHPLPYRCKYCAALFTTDDGRNTHEDIHYRKRRFQCRYCGRRYKKSWHRNDHERLHQGNARFKCEACDHPCHKPSDLWRHELKHHRKGAYSCPECDMTYANFRCFQYHWKLKHKAFVPPWKLGMELTKQNHSMKTKKSREISKTTLEQDKTEKSLEQDISEKSLEQDKTEKSVLVNHKDDIRNYACPKCSSCFKTKHHLLEHVVIHDPNLQHKCEICNRRFVRLIRLWRHEKKHSGLRKHKCPECRSRFFNKGSVLYHRKTEHGYKLKIFNSAGTLDKNSQMNKSLQKSLLVNGEVRIEPKRNNEMKVKKCRKDLIPEVRSTMKHSSTFRSRQATENSTVPTGVKNATDILTKNETLKAKTPTNKKHTLKKKQLSPEISRNKNVKVKTSTSKNHAMEKNEKSQEISTKVKKVNKTLTNKTHAIEEDPMTPYHEEMAGKKNMKAKKTSNVKHAVEKSQKSTEISGNNQVRTQIDNHVLKSNQNVGGRGFKCPDCPKSFFKAYNLAVHRRLHNPNLLYKCEICQKLFSRRINLWHHEEVHVNGGCMYNYKCQGCKAMFFSQGSLEYHSNIEHGYKLTPKSARKNGSHRIKTKMARKDRTAKLQTKARQEKGRKMTRNEDRGKLTRKVTRRGDSKRTTKMTRVEDNCKVVQPKATRIEEGGACKLKTNTEPKRSLKKSLQLQLDAIEVKIAITCSYCTESFFDADDAMTHEETHLENMCTFKGCTETFKSLEQLPKHFKQNHPGEYPFKCTFCKKGFSSYATVISHEKLHFPESLESLPYICVICERRFDQPSELYYHEIGHDEDSPRSQSCTKCDVKCINLVSLMYHKKLEHGMSYKQQGLHKVRNVWKTKCLQQSRTLMTSRQSRGNGISSNKRLRMSPRRQSDDHLISGHIPNGLNVSLVKMPIVGDDNTEGRWLEKQDVVAEDGAFICELCTEEFECERELRRHKRFHAVQIEAMQSLMQPQEGNDSTIKQKSNGLVKSSIRGGRKEKTFAFQKAASISRKSRGRFQMNKRSKRAAFRRGMLRMRNSQRNNKVAAMNVDDKVAQIMKRLSWETGHENENKLVVERRFRARTSANNELHEDKPADKLIGGLDDDVVEIPVVKLLDQEKVKPLNQEKQGKSLKQVKRCNDLASGNNNVKLQGHEKVVRSFKSGKRPCDIDDDVIEIPAPKSPRGSSSSEKKVIKNGHIHVKMVKLNKDVKLNSSVGNLQVSSNNMRPSNFLKLLKETEKEREDGKAFVSRVIPVLYNGYCRSCIQCGKRFETDEALKEHKKWHKCDKRIRCLECNMWCDNDKAYRKHWKEHALNRLLYCRYCGKDFPDKELLWRHEKTHNKDGNGNGNGGGGNQKIVMEEKKHACDMCSESFVTAEELKVHQVSHSAPRAFVCEHCSMSFNQERQLRSHQTRHVGDLATWQKSFGCPLCGGMFKSSNDLKDHERTFHGCDGKFECKYCDRSFGVEKNWRAHEKNHKLRKDKPKKKR